MKSLSKKFLRLSTAFSIVAIIILLVCLVNLSRPGGRLYSLDLATENLYVVISSLIGDTSLAKVHMKIARERVSEIHKLVETSPQDTTGLVEHALAQELNAPDQSVEPELETLISDAVDNLGKHLNSAEEILNRLVRDEPERAVRIADEISNISNELETDLAEIEGGSEGSISEVLRDALDDASTLSKDSMKFLLSSQAENPDSITEDHIQKVLERIVAAEESLIRTQERYAERSSRLDSSLKSEIEAYISLSASNLQSARDSEYAGDYLQAIEWAESSRNYSGIARDLTEDVDNQSNEATTKARERIREADNEISELIRKISFEKEINSGALLSAKDLLEQARNSLSQARTSFNNGDYIQTLINANEAEEWAKEGQRVMDQGEDSTRDRAKEVIDLIEDTKDKLKDLDEKLREDESRNLTEASKYMSTATSILAEAQAAYDSGEFVSAQSLVEQSQKHIQIALNLVDDKNESSDRDDESDRSKEEESHEDSSNDNNNDKEDEHIEENEVSRNESPKTDGSNKEPVESKDSDNFESRDSDDGEDEEVSPEEHEEPEEPEESEEDEEPEEPEEPEKPEEDEEPEEPEERELQGTNLESAILGAETSNSNRTDSMKSYSTAEVVLTILVGTNIIVSGLTLKKVIKKPEK